MSAVAERLWRRITMMVGYGTITATDDGGPSQRHQLQLMHGERHDNVVQILQYGFSSRPMPGAQVVTLCLGGQRTNMIAIGTADSRHRPTGLQPGGVAMHNDQVVITLNGKNVTITGAETITMQASEKVRMETPLLEVTGDVKAGDDHVSLTTHVHSGVHTGTDDTGEPV